MARPPDDEPPDRDTELTEPLPAVREERFGYVEEPLVEEEVVEQPPRRPPRLWPYLLALLVLVLAGLGALWYFSQEDEPELVPLASVVRLQEGDAVQRLSDDGFEVEIDRRLSDQAPQGIVFAQRPEAGTDLEEGSTVTILVSSGEATAEVPDVSGLPIERAERLLRDAGFDTRQFSVFSQLEEGTVVAQDPVGGERARTGTSVRVNVSRGRGTVEVPNVVGQTADEAGSILRQANLATPNVVSVPSERPADEVVAQNPAAGTQVRPRTVVRINVSNGRGEGTTTTAPVGEEVPDVVGLPEDEARLALEDIGATVRVSRESVSDPAQDGVVLRQDPPGGESIVPPETVEIVVGRLVE
jgi:beta-lactam-binding protein with PASTA domain